MLLFKRLGDRISAEWLKYNHDELAFPDIATNALAQSGVDRLQPAELARWLTTSVELPAQTGDNDFGQPPVRVYVGHKFLIEVLYWLDSTTAVHQHGFSGALGVIAGSSLHSVYTFECRERVSEQLLVGDLRFQRAELLEAGAVRTIHSGARFIHALFHLDRPSISIVVRTLDEPWTRPQYNYRAPALAMDPLFKPEPHFTQLRLLETLRKSQDDLFAECALAILARADLWLTINVLGLAYDEKNPSAHWSQLEAAARVRHGRRVDDLVRSFAGCARQMNIVNRRTSVHEPEHRYFLALLLNLPNREAILELVRARHRDDAPEERILRWVDELSKRNLIGLNFNAVSLQLLRLAMRGLPLEVAKAQLGEVFGAEKVHAHGAELDRLWGQMHGASMLAPLLVSRDAPARSPVGPPSRHEPGTSRGVPASSTV